jgi:hypothetical protein
MIKRLTYPAAVTFLECAKRFELFWIEERPIPRMQPFALVGNLHTALFSYLQSRIDGKPMSGNDCVSLFVNSFRSKVEAQGVKAASIGARDDDPVLMENQTVAVLRTYLQWLDKTGLKPTAVNREMHHSFQGVDLTGHIEIMDSSGIVIDVKMPQTPWSAERLQNDLQPLFYAALLGRPIEFHYHFLLRRPAPEIRWASRSVTQGAMDWFVNEYLPPLCKAIQDGPYPYADPASPSCGPGECEYWDVCKSGAQRSANR